MDAEGVARKCRWSGKLLNVSAPPTKRLRERRQEDSPIEQIPKMAIMQRHTGFW